MMTQEHRAALREAASKATPGPWEVQPACARFDSSVPVVMQDNDGFSIAEMCRGIAGEPEEDNAAYIALAHPAAVLALLDECDALRAALDAAERERDEARRHANEGRQAEADADRDRHAALVTLNQLFKEHTDMIAERDAADATGYARGVRDAAGVCQARHKGMAHIREYAEAQWCAAAILALLPATDATKEKNDAE